MVPYYEYALDMVLDVEMPMEDSLTEEQQEIMESAAEMLYGLIHARYVEPSFSLSDLQFLFNGMFSTILILTNVLCPKIHHYKSGDALNV
jgi:Casein kinase II regulatory subunit